MANEQSKPLQYEVAGRPMAIFYADVVAARPVNVLTAGAAPQELSDAMIRSAFLDAKGTVSTGSNLRIADSEVGPNDSASQVLLNPTWRL